MQSKLMSVILVIPEHTVWLVTDPSFITDTA
jgi:hypothetical protein